MLKENLTISALVGEGEEIQKFADRLRGELITPADGGYDKARSLYNAMIDKRPAAIVRCENVADVIAAVNFARQNNLDLAIHGGGHNGAGLGMVDGGLVIDLSLMNGIRVDPQARTVRVQGGCTWAEVDRATHAFGLAVPSGIISTTGVGGLTLGGGHGYLARKYGLTIDNLLEVDMVLADGCVITWCYTGPLDKAEEVFRPIRELGTPVLDMAGPMPYPALQRMFDQLYYPPGLQWYWKADFVKELSDEAIKIHRQYGGALPTEISTMHLYPINGAVHDVGQDEAAFNYRDVTWSNVIVGVDPDPANAEMITKWAKEYWAALHPHSAGGGYVNFMMEEGLDRIRATYRDNYDRLVEIKRRYDPENLFHVNQNVKPD